MTNNDIANILMLVLGLMLLILFSLIVIFILIKVKSNKSNKTEKIEKVSDKTKVQQLYSIHSIFNFMEFDKIEDNMIVQKKGQKYIMILKCQGINYDLMSGVEKTGVEQGFIQFLNTLRYPVQIYIQTRTVDLTGSINTYKEKLVELENNYESKDFEYNQMVRKGGYSQSELDAEKFEVLKTKKLYEYGADIVNNTERMSLNKNILAKQYYVVLSYYPEEAANGIYSQEEISNIAFSELYTRAQSTISLLNVCGITSKILDSEELADLLYFAYNRDEAETYDLKRAIDAGFDNLYTTAPDVLQKKMKELDKQIEREAIQKANQAVLEVRHEAEMERKVREKEESFKEMVDQMAELIIESNEDILGAEVVQKSKEKINKSKHTNVSKEEDNNEKNKKAAKRTGRIRKSA